MIARTDQLTTSSGMDSEDGRRRTVVSARDLSDSATRVARARQRIASGFYNTQKPLTPKMLDRLARAIAAS